MDKKLILKSGKEYKGRSFGADKSAAGELVFATGMVGYVESLTDPSYRGQILVMTYPLLGNYGVPDKSNWESDKIQVAGLIVSSYIDTPSHHASLKSLGKWLRDENIPALEIRDTRALAINLRQKGSLPGKIVINKNIRFEDPNLSNLVAEVSVKRPKIYGKGSKTVVVLDCGIKRNIIRELVERKVKVILAPWNFDPFAEKIKFQGLLISNGPGNPKMCVETIAIVKKALINNMPIFGICLGNQILALSAGGDTDKMKFGHRGQNQPVSRLGSKKCFLTTQNHGFEVKKVPQGFKPWFVNLNDNTNEGIVHKSKPFMSVQFHPESCPGPLDTGWLFDEFIKNI
ncbi:MAG: carbamoyl-phosphate synthase (glutamine-hydrolyzing) small subunit [Candidatus Doudnabacteria bacterium CG10_big_fil_rev_8_21_14_0_10_42_18]|uniref:Carbamoyl phosphate synthase small chain n=1 Tax=Candidatus Doudnabacteria bacterium CG10_big_fil_rev_8_21_14_0_10_42_18 TaxID=1974552 RepID=A0A2H0VAX3_9BACT|nr:MAG: carbamoyl-phosphate synthase (glutamine-hydrolyzing) small subunit [Candidatus Doudnabacteria bacterium CG10_big_fil_rev_8_21_14_0_10_42_18]